MIAHYSMFFDATFVVSLLAHLQVFPLGLVFRHELGNLPENVLDFLNPVVHTLGAKILFPTVVFPTSKVRRLGNTRFCCIGNEIAFLLTTCTNGVCQFCATTWSTAQIGIEWKGLAR